MHTIGKNALNTFYVQGCPGPVKGTYYMGPCPPFEKPTVSLESKSNLWKRVLTNNGICQRRALFQGQSITSATGRGPLPPSRRSTKDFLSQLSLKGAGRTYARMWLGLVRFHHGQDPLSNFTQPGLRNRFYYEKGKRTWLSSKKKEGKVSPDSPSTPRRGPLRFRLC